ncbi:8-amino-3,8-dideoxy-manno-octulosonate cytidylyltransferase [Fusobacterium necrophorum]|nr:N-acetylneuraminate synthase family protein [Fusobacterium necrophorum]MBR8734768.1 8-amino-3,8-dideoxy-manno-octulosonate cytidylyltransferase [Fusobacterium necrophorum]MBR8790944.1 8-amino-3,8-dideoxy-manno-octulosonate cytidylyltransferase [Fusobacterium necrophorum]
MYNILEVANCHGGDINYLYTLIDKYSIFDKKEKFGMKFQPFKYDLIAMETYSWYPVYKNLFFTKKEWENILGKAFVTKDVWLDIFDEYGLEILEDNLDKIEGIKFQTSILDNLIIFRKLGEINTSNLKIILNIAGRSLDEIDSIINKYSLLKFKEIYLEVGFQGYPTSIKDCGISKIAVLKERYNNIKIVFADHADSQTDEAITLPLLVGFNCCDIIEKHIMLDRENTKYDFYSSLTFEQYKKFIDEQKKYFGLKIEKFINEKEREYLKKSLQIPILNKDKKAGELIDIENDFEFKRNDSYGLNVVELKKYISEKYILNSDRQKGETIRKEDIRKANIAVIIACRLKSSRLKRKALLKIGSISSVEMCIKNILKFKDVNSIVLATSTTEQDSELKNYTYNENVIFHQGDPDDVIQRYLDIIEKKNFDVIIRVTGDCPYLSSDIAEVILNSHFEKGAEYSNGIGAAVGTNLEVINSLSLKEVKKYFPKADYSEYMTWYFQNNSEIFKLNYVNLPNKWKRDYRLTLDYQEDLELFNKIERYFLENNIDYSIDEMYKYLDNNPEVVKINSHLTLKYKTDVGLIETLNKVTKINKGN